MIDERHNNDLNDKHTILWYSASAMYGIAGQWHAIA